MKKEKRTEKLVPVKIKRHHDNKGGHNHVILGNMGKNHISVGLTTKPKKGKNAPNFKCKVNPLGGAETSYMRRQGTVDDKKNYGQTVKKGNMHPDDYAKAKEYGNKAKQKYAEKKGKKK